MPEDWGLRPMGVALEPVRVAALLDRMAMETAERSVGALADRGTQVLAELGDWLDHRLR